MAKKFFFTGTLCMALVCGVLVSGCGGGGGGIDSALVAKWHQYQADADNGANAVFELTSDGRLLDGDLGIITAGEWKVTVSGAKRISATCTLNGQTVDMGTADYDIQGTELTFSNFTGAPNNIFKKLDLSVSTSGGKYYRSGSGDNNGSSNPFLGTWTGSDADGNSYTLTITSSGWELWDIAKGAYTQNGSGATLTSTHSWVGSWQPIPQGEAEQYTLTVSGTGMSCTDPSGKSVSLTKGPGVNTLVITDMPPTVAYQLEGAYIFIAPLGAPTGGIGVAGGYGLTAGATLIEGTYTRTGPNSSQLYTVTIPLRRQVMNSNSGQPGPWTGDGTCDVYFRAASPSYTLYKSNSPVSFSPGATKTVSYYQFQQTP
jgi:hypothetical protein